MSTRKVIVASPSTNKAKTFDVSDDVKTWGDLKPLISELMVGDVEAVVNPGNMTMKLDSAELPSGEFRVYLIPTKNKAGQEITEQGAKNLGSDIAQAIITAQSVASNEQIADLKQVIIDAIAEFFDVDSDQITPAEVSNAAEAAALTAAKAYLV